MSTSSLVVRLLALIALPNLVIAATITVNNPSFETFNPLNITCITGAGCAYNQSAIPGWTNSGDSGSWRPGNPSNTLYFDFIPDGTTVGYTNSNLISQTVGVTAIAGRTYTLQVDIGNRKDFAAGGQARLVVGTNTIIATGSAIPEGGWVTYTASYTATSADADTAIAIELAAVAVQADFDNVRLADDSGGGAVPEPATCVVTGLGLFAAAAASRFRRR